MHGFYPLLRSIVRSLTFALLASCALAAQTGGQSVAGAIAGTITGIWSGKIAGYLPIVVHVRAAGHGLAVSMDSPTQGVTGMTGTSVVWNPPHLSFAVPSVHGSYAGVLAPGGTIRGTWTQGRSAPLVLHRGTDAAKVAAPAPFVFPPNVREVPVAFPTGRGNLAGALTEPGGEPPTAGWPAAVIIAGSGPTDRNGDNPSEPVQLHPYAKLAAYLSSHGYAVLRYDKRGVAASAHAPRPRHFHRFASDARWAALFLMRRQGMDAHRVSLIGHSLGSSLALLAAGETTPALPAPLAAIVSLEGAGRPTAAVIHWQVQNGLRRAHAPANVQENFLAHLDRVLANIVARRPVTLADAGKDSLLRALIAQLPVTRGFVALDPIDAAREDRVPTLVVQGGKDIQVTPALDARPLDAAIPASTPHALRVFPNMTHMLIDYAGAPGPAEYSAPATTPLDPAMLGTVVGWLAKH